MVEQIKIKLDPKFVKINEANCYNVYTEHNRLVIEIRNNWKFISFLFEINWFLILQIFQIWA